MKQKIKNYLKFGILLFGVSLILTNCQKDDDFHSTNKNPNTINKSNYKIKNINLKDLQRNKSVFQKVSKINFKTANKIVNDTINGFSIDTETGIYIENGNYHSYTFRIDRATPNNFLLENLVLSKKDTSYQTILYQYNITQEEFNLISQQQFVNLEGKITLTLIDNNTLGENILGKYFFNGNCYQNDYVYVEGQTCGGTGDQNHTYLEAISGQYCSQLGTEFGPTPSGYVYQSVQVACDATTGGGINNSNTPINNNHGGINYDNHATSPNTFCSRCDDLEDPDIDVQDDDDDDDCVSDQQTELNNLLLQINSPTISSDTNNFLIENNFTCEAYQTALMLVESLLNNYSFDDFELGPSCESFDFQTITTEAYWQNSAVKNIRFRVVVLSPHGNYVNFDILYPQPILFGVPTNMLNGGDISSGLAAELSAQALSVSMSEVVNTYGNQPVSELQVRLYFEQRLKYNFPIITNGGRVTFNPMVLPVTPTEYETNLFGTGSCD